MTMRFDAFISYMACTKCLTLLLHGSMSTCRHTKRDFTKLSYECALTKDVGKI